MSEPLFSKTDYPVSTLISNIDRGEIALPDIQRPFVWKAAKVRDLFDSLYRGFPVGYLLFWRYGSPSGGRQIGTDQKEDVPRLLVVDGQQRLTSLFAVMRDQEVLNENYEEVELNISFRPADGSFEVATAASRRDPEYIDDISVLWSPETQIFDFIGQFLERLQKRKDISEEK